MPTGRVGILVSMMVNNFCHEKVPDVETSVQAKS